MIDFKQHLKGLTVILYMLTVLLVLSILSSILGAREYFFQYVRIINYLEIIIILIASLYYLFVFYLGVFQGITIKEKKFAVTKEKEKGFYYYMIVFLLLGIFGLYFSIKQLIGLIG